MIEITFKKCLIDLYLILFLSFKPLYPFGYSLNLVLVNFLKTIFYELI